MTGSLWQINLVHVQNGRFDLGKLQGSLGRGLKLVLNESLGKGANQTAGNILHKILTSRLFDGEYCRS